MKILTRKVQKEIRQDRDVLYDYLVSTFPPVERMGDYERAIGALAEMSCNCGLWDKPWKNDGGSEE